LEQKIKTLINAGGSSKASVLNRRRVSFKRRGFEVRVIKRWAFNY